MQQHGRGCGGSWCAFATVVVHTLDAFAVWWPATMALRRQVLALLSVSMLLCLLPRSLICCTIADLTSSLPLKASARHRIE